MSSSFYVFLKILVKEGGYNGTTKFDNPKNDLKEYEDKIRQLVDIENPSRELLQALIDKIIIDKDRNVEIVYKFSILNN